MDLTVQIVIIIGVLVFSAGFIVLVISIVSSLSRLKLLFVHVEKMSVEITNLAREIKNISARVEDKLDKVDSVIESSKKAVKIAGDIASFISTNVFTKAAGIMGLLPAIKLGWQLIKDMKGGNKNVE
jgi:predicted PurR-regulated permease PerM